MMVLFCPPFVPFSEGSVKSTDEVHVLEKMQSGSLGMVLHPYIVILVHRMYISGESVTSRENGAPLESKKVVLEVLDIFTKKLLGASRGPEGIIKKYVELDKERVSM